MTKQEEDARVAAAVAKQLETIIAAQQKQFAETMEMVMKNSLGGVDNANAELEKERKAVQKELDAAQKLRAKAEKEGDKMADAYFENRQKQFSEAAKTAMLRELTLLHIGVGKKNLEIANWLDVPMDFVENIRQLVLCQEKYRGEKLKRLKLEGNPKVRTEGSGRGGTVWFESRESTFDMWWEFAGGSALVIVDIPTTENWEVRTKLPLERRNDILTFIGEHLVDTETHGAGSFIIGENVLTVYS